jgi:hypothetical protein
LRLAGPDVASDEVAAHLQLIERIAFVHLGSLVSPFWFTPRLSGKAHARCLRLGVGQPPPSTKLL